MPDEPGVEPVATDGRSAPAPVTYMVTVCPRAAVELGTMAPLVSVKIPGAADAMAIDVDEVRPLLLTTTGTVPLAGVS